MGIDIYMHWKNQTEKEKEAQFKGYDTTIGDAGYLREAYHGDPYATQLLVPEAFAAKECEAKIAAALLKKRLPEVIKAAIKREKTIYKEKNVTKQTPSVASFTHFVELAEKKEKETGEPVTISASY